MLCCHVDNFCDAVNCSLHHTVHLFGIVRKIMDSINNDNHSNIPWVQRFPLCQCIQNLRGSSLVLL